MAATAIEHEHLPRLVEVVFDDAGPSVREFTCATCLAFWYE